MNNPTGKSATATRKIALVTGGAQGIGYACAETLKEDGAPVVLADIQKEGIGDTEE